MTRTPVGPYTTLATDGISEVQGPDGLWHRWAGPGYPSIHLTACGATPPVATSRTRAGGELTCSACADDEARYLRSLS